MIVLGLDPGVATTGYGIVEQIGSKLNLITYGTIKTAPTTPFSKRLNEISIFCSDLIRQFTPDSIAVEELFFTNNAKI